MSWFYEAALRRDINNAYGSIHNIDDDQLYQHVLIYYKLFFHNPLI